MQSLFVANISLIHTLMHLNYLSIQKLNEKVAFLFISNEFGFVIRTNMFQWQFVDLISLLVLFLFDLLTEQKSKIRDSNDNFSNALL